MPRWFDDGCRVRLSVSTAGDFVALGTRTEYPFVASGANAPVGWTAIAANGGVIGDVNWTTANGRFSVSNISTTDPNINKQYGIYRDFPVTYGKRYVLWVQSRTMDNKANAFYQLLYSFNGTDGPYGFGNDTANDWEQLACYMLPTNSGTTFIRVWLYVYYPGAEPGQNPRPDWGGQWQLPAMVEFDSTYPDPTWKEVTCDVQSLNVAYGRSKFTGRFEVASAQIGVRNVDGEFTYQPIHPWGLRPGRFVKAEIREPKSGTYYPVYYGLIDSVTDSFPIDGKVTAVLNCIDNSSLLSTSTVPTESSATLSTLSGIRWRSLLDNASYHPQMRSFDSGIYYQQGVLQSGRTVRDELGLIADSEGAYFWTDRNGILTYRDRNYVANNRRSTTVYAELVAECPEYLDSVKFVFPGVAGNNMTVPYEQGFDNGSYVTVEALIRLTNVSSGNRQTIASKDNVWVFRKEANGKRLQFNNWGGFATSSADIPYGNNVWFWVRTAYNIAAATVTFWTASVGGLWVQLGTVQSISQTIPTVQGGMRIGETTGGIDSLSGNIDTVRIGNGSINVLSFGASDFPGQSGATTLNIRATGQTITVNQTGANVIVQTDTDIAPHQLPPVDQIPTYSNATIVPLKALETDWSRDRVVNDVQIANKGGSAYQAVDHDSQQQYGPRTYQRLDFLNDNAYPQYLVERTADFMDGFTDSILRVNRVTFTPDINTYKWVLEMFLMELVRVRYQHPTEQWGYAIATFIQGYTHSLTMNGWEVSLNLDQPKSFAYWAGSSDGIGWDTGAWDATYWDSAEVGAVWDAGYHDEDIWDSVDPDGAYWGSGQQWTNPPTKWGA